jgi:hypothetical protein
MSSRLLGLKLERNGTWQPAMSEMGYSLPDCDVRVASVHPSISDIMRQRRERRNGPISEVPASLDLIHDGRVASSACASAISENSGVGEKPSSAEARMSWASAARLVL